MNRRTMLKLCAAAPLAAQPARALALNRPSWDGERWRVEFLDFTSPMNRPAIMFRRWIMTIDPDGPETFQIWGVKDQEPVLRSSAIIELVCSETATWFHRLEFRTPLVVLRGETLRLDLGSRISDREIPMSTDHLVRPPDMLPGMTWSQSQSNERTFTFG